MFFTTLTRLELIKLRHEAIEINDKPTKDMIDAELKRRLDA